ncbi:hypothetical protein MAPG_07229 [Magnaporthiopsis poae ATCC 64411]|uniref:Transmembrane protein n=1 Tax=Magnaporthiopsis poae (strain ATCC 64411 / 73-15) TaxID=644358 RepID=A0A0C4E441_MAGP6|nr:hypothetical protein MAPG_07229 [Magnaporthiopsis poae ATCC 64411]
MAPSPRTNFVIILGLGLFSVVAADRPYDTYPREQFDRFLPEWNGLIQGILQSNCSEVLEAYRTRTSDQNPPGLTYDPTRRVIECVMEHMEEFRKLDMAISAVLLGLTPTILQSLACTTLDLAFLSLRRPLLAFLLAVGSPIVSSTRTTQFQKGVQDVVAKGKRSDVNQRRPLHWSWCLVTLVQYAAACGCVANMVNLSYELGVHAMTVISPRFTHQVALWGILATIVHICASAGLRFRVRVEGCGSPTSGPDFPNALAALPAWIRDEVVPSTYNSPLSLDNLHDGIWFSLLSWAVSVANVFITLYGTVVLSGLLFFSIKDSLSIVVRYIASVIVCRAVFVYERTGMGFSPE